MHYPVNEETKKPYGILKGEKVKEPVTLEESTEERAKDAEPLGVAIEKKAKEIPVKKEEKKKK